MDLYFHAQLQTLNTYNSYYYCRKNKKLGENVPRPLWLGADMSDTHAGTKQEQMLNVLIAVQPLSSCCTVFVPLKMSVAH